MHHARRAAVALAALTALLTAGSVPASASPAAPDPLFVPNERLVQVHGSDQPAPEPATTSRSALRTSQAAPSATFVVDYQGFSTEQRDAFQAAVDTWARLLSSPVPIRIDARIAAQPPGVLGSAGPTGFVVDDADGRYGPEDTLVPVALANALTGRDLAPEAADVDAEFASDPTLFSYGTDPEPGRYDFTTVVLHEIGHGLGFAGAMDVVADSSGTERGYWNPGTTTPRPFTFDRYASELQADGTLRPLLSVQRGSVALADALTTGRTVWTGAQGQAANGGRPVELYTPADWFPGSSYSHLDEDLYPSGTPDALMTPSIDLGEVVRDPGTVALGMLADMGWGTSASALRLSGPSSVAAGSTVPVTGVAPPGSVVSIFFKRRGQTVTTPGAQPGYTLQRQLTAAPDGTFSTTYAGVDDHRYYAVAGDRVSEPVLTQIRPTITGSQVRRVPKGSSLSLAGRGLPGTTLTLRFTRNDGSDVVRTVGIASDGTWFRNLVLVEDLRVVAGGVNGQRSDAVLLQVR